MIRQADEVKVFEISAGTFRWSMTSTAIPAKGRGQPVLQTDGEHAFETDFHTDADEIPWKGIVAVRCDDTTAYKNDK
ncbi:hypothetical protein HGI30_03380 [Paenibacillus albicereus]|uniref:Uncharacterized protein n=1 Tax=Paenibacillus albicereus TaxID=2726185 RepID=A0A6H2GTH6_9BACL|nr:hypothetical protein [Paenibacillus albicereus]QJC50710.1 hypothetical protein HGI30_03380 [Paenibacillus albicereus]